MTDRGTAETVGAQWILTVYQSRQCAVDGGAAIRVCTREPVEVDGGLYHPLLDAGFSIVDSLTIDGRQVSVSFGWDQGFELSPSELPLSDGWAELALLDDGGTPDTTVGIAGKVKGVQWGRVTDSVSFQIVADGPDLEKGTIYRANQVISSTRSADVANTGDNDRAPQSDGAWPPLIFASERYTPNFFETPAYVMVDEAIASHLTPTDLTPRKWLVCDGALWQGSSRAFRLSDLNGGAGLYGAYTTVAVTTETDDSGQTYTAVDGGSQLVESMGFDVSTTNASTTITAETNYSFNQSLRVGDQIRRNGEAADDWDRVASIDSDSRVTLEYIHGTTGTSEGERLRLPASQPVSGWFYPEGKGGLPGIWRDGPLFHAVELLEWLLSRTDLGGLRLHVGDLRAIGHQMPGLDVHTVITDNDGAFAWVAANILSMLPIVPYVEAGMLRWYLDPVFGQVLPTTTIDLDLETDVELEGGVMWDEGEKITEFQLSHSFNIRLQRYRRVSVVNRSNNARVGSVRYASGLQGDTATKTGKSPVFFTGRVGEVAAQWRVILGARRLVGRVAMPPRYRYLKKLDVVGLSQDSGPVDGVDARLVSVSRQGDGALTASFESIVR